MTETVLLFVCSMAFVLFTAFFVLAETALISCDKIFLSRKKKEGSANASIAFKLLEDIDLLFSTTQFGSNLGMATASTLATLAIKKSFENNQFLVLVVVAPFALVLSDSLPKVIGRYYSEKCSLLVAVPLYLFSQIFSPVLLLISVYTKRISHWVGLGRQDALSRRRKTREELQAILSDGDVESGIRQGHKRIIKKILDFSQQNVKKAMLPLVNVDGIEQDSTVQEAIDMFETLRHSRLPVYEERIDNIVGILYFPDMFMCKRPDSETVKKYMRPPLYVPEMQQLESLTKELQDSEMAIVVDEYGGAVGIVTKEDVVEEIVGDISDEWDEPNRSILEISADSYLVHVTTSINDINEKLKIQLPKGEYETLSGFLLMQFNRIPTVGDELFYGNLRFKVHKANKKAIETVIIEIQKSETEDT